MPQLFQQFTLWHFGWSLETKNQPEESPFVPRFYVFFICLCLMNDYGSIALTVVCFHVYGGTPCFVPWHIGVKEAIAFFQVMQQKCPS